MNKEIINITEDGRVNLSCYYRSPAETVPNLDKTPAVLVLPGGGYTILSPREAEPIAFNYFANGYTSFVLRYSIKEHAAFPNSLIECFKAIKIIRENAEKFNIDPNKIVVIGFSAGGHLAATLGTLWNNKELMAKASIIKEENKPNALILGYPVISTDWMKKDIKFNNNLQINFSKDKEAQLVEAHKNVGPHTPPTFLMHTTEDATVPSTDSLKFAIALEENSIPYELHIFEKGCHGLSLGTKLTDTGNGDQINYNFSQWFKLSLNWLKEIL